MREWKPNSGHIFKLHKYLFAAVCIEETKLTHRIQSHMVQFIWATKYSLVLRDMSVEEYFNYQHENVQ